MKDKEFDNILDNCLERVLFKGETIEQCLQSYPELASELEPLLQMALVTKEASNILPDTEFRARASYQFRSALEEAYAAKSRRFFGWQSRWATAATVFVAVVLLCAGTAAAANNSMPSQFLYPAKLATEQVRLVLTPSAMGKAELYASLADERVSEIIYAADTGNAEQIEQVNQRLSSHLDNIAILAGGQVETDGKALFQAAPESTLAPTLKPTTAPAPTTIPVPTITPAPTTVPSLAPPNAGGAENTTPVAPAPREAWEDGKEDLAQDDEQTELMVIVQGYAVDHPALLREALETAPESVKASLLQSISISETGYEKVLQAIGQIE